MPWLTDLRRQLLETFPLKAGLRAIPNDQLLKPKWILTSVHQNDATIDTFLLNGITSNVPDVDGVSSPTDGPSSASSDGNSRLNAEDEGRLLKVTLEENTRVTPRSHWQDVRHLVFSSSSPGEYRPGDVLTIFPRNSEDDIDQLIKAMDWAGIADKPIKLVPLGANPDAHLYPPPPILITPTDRLMTLRQLLTRHLDLNAIPKRSFFSSVAHFTQNEMHKERLFEFTKAEYIDELYDYTTRPRRSILEVLQEFDSIKIPWQWAANVLPELRGRQFSIASGGDLKSNPDGSARFELLVAIVKYRTVIKKVREGLCTRYLAGLPRGSQLEVMLQKGSLGITQAHANRPIVMVGPGTGIAPVRSLIWEQMQWAKKPVQMNVGMTKNHGSSQPPMALFFGCRNKDADYFFSKEWEQINDKFPLEVFTAFSRDQTKKIYVQDLIKEQSELVYRLLHNAGGTLLVCGSSGKMPQAVRIAIAEAFKMQGDEHQDESEAYIQLMEREGRYKQETW